MKATEEQAFPGVTVALLAHKPGSREMETLERVRNQTYQGRSIIHVVDSSPEPHGQTNQWLRAKADVWDRIPPEAFHHAATRNRAVDSCQTPLIVFLSQDAHPSDDSWLENLIRPLIFGEAEASYGKQRPPAPDWERESTFAYLYPEVSEIKTIERLADLGIRTFHFSDVCSAFLTDVIRRVRFPEDIPIFEDVGVARRLLTMGYRIAYVSEATVLHSHDMTWSEIWKRYNRIGTIYQQLGIFDELSKSPQNSYLRTGLRAIRSMAAAGGHSPGNIIKNLAIAGIKAGAMTNGRWRGARRFRSASKSD